MNEIVVARDEATSNLRSNRIQVRWLSWFFLPALLVAQGGGGTDWMLLVIGFGIAAALYVLHDIAYFLEIRYREEAARER